LLVFWDVTQIFLSIQPHAYGTSNKLVSRVSFILGSLVALLLAATRYAGSPATNIVVGVIAFLFGYILLRRPSKEASIAESDYELLKGGALEQAEVVTNYRALRELTGLPGFFRNLGITGLPLATIAVLAISSYGINAIGRAFAATVDVKDIIPTEFPTAILELSKLLLGAFIGSFVAKSGTIVQSRDKVTHATPATTPGQKKPGQDISAL
jgi:hypothetical protein